MMVKYTEAELNEFGKKHLVRLLLEQQEQLARLNDNMERLIEQFSIMQNNRFGRKTERMDQIPGKLSFFNEMEAACDPNEPEPEIEEVVRKVKKKKQKGKRELDLEGLPEEDVPHSLADEKLDDFLWPRVLAPYEA